MKVGYISRREDPATGKETFVYRDANVTRRIGVKSDTVKIPFLYGTYPTEEVWSNTDMLVRNPKLILCSEPFFTYDALRKRCMKWCEWANSCEHREYSFFGEG